MQKCLFISTIFSPQVGGIEICLENIIKRLPPQHVVVLTQSARQSQAFDRKQRYRIYRRGLELRFFKPRWLFSPLFALGVAHKEKIRCVQAAHGFASYLAAWFLKKVLGLPYFVWAYGLDLLAMQKSRWVRFGVKKIFREAAGGIANSHFTAGLMHALGLPAARIKVVYPGVDGDIFKLGVAIDEVRRKYHLPAQKKVLLSVSRLVARKGFDQVIRAMPEILKTFPDTVYLIGGKGPDETRLRKIVRGLRRSAEQKAIQFIGFVEDRDLPAFYNLADIFLMPSRFLKQAGDVEGFGMVFLEAGACGCPVIGGRSGGIPEAIIDQKTGFLVDPADPKDLAIKVKTLLADEGMRRRMGENARRRALQRFNWQRITQDFEQALGGD